MLDFVTYLLFCFEKIAVVFVLNIVKYNIVKLCVFLAKSGRIST